MNETKLSGRLTKDPVVRYTSSGKVVTQFILAVDRIRKDDKNEADFIPVVFWGKSAEIIGNSLKKGSKILVAVFIFCNDCRTNACIHQHYHVISFNSFGNLRNVVAIEGNFKIFIFIVCN